MKVGVVGTGTMGRGIVQLALSGNKTNAGHAVWAIDGSAAAVAGLKEGLQKTFARLVQKGSMTEVGAEDALSKLNVSSDLKKLAACDLVIEAVTEDLETKKHLLAALEEIVSPACILASNTSSLSVTALAAACKHPERVIGLHFFNPAPLMQLVEVVSALQSKDSILQQAAALVRSWGKTPIGVKDSPAFVVNRIARPYYGEALRILEEGIADAATIDWAMENIGKFRMGPFALMDLIGIDVNYTVSEAVFEAFYYDSRYRPSLTQKRMLEAGRLGRKSGRGFFNYHEGASKPEPRTDADLGNKIFERILLMIINEASEALFWNVACPEAIEQAMTLGVNYPKGPLHWADEFGLARVVTKLENLHKEYGEERYRPSVLLRRMLSESRTFFGTNV